MARCLVLDEVTELFWELVRDAEADPDVPEVVPATINVPALESALGQPAQTWEGEDLYPDLFLKAAVYARGIIQGHVFGNGNKRMGLTAAFVFIEMNGYRVEMGRDEAVALALHIANRRITLEQIADVLQRHSVRITQ